MVRIRYGIDRDFKAIDSHVPGKKDITGWFFWFFLRLRKRKKKEKKEKRKKKIKIKIKKENKKKIGKRCRF